MSYIGNKDWLIEVRRGNIVGARVVHKFGKNPAVPNGTWAFATPLGQTGHALSAATTVRVKAGGNVNDTAAGSGARSVTVQGIDDSFAEVEETIATAGGSASAVTTALFWRVHRAWVAAGTYGGNNTGDVDIENGAGGTDILTLLAGEGQSQESVYTIPLGEEAYLLGADFTVEGTKAADIRIFTRHDIDDTSAPMPAARIKKFFAGVDGESHYYPRSPDIHIPAKADIWVEANGSGALTTVSADLELLIITT